MLNHKVLICYIILSCLLVGVRQAPGQHDIAKTSSMDTVSVQQRASQTERSAGIHFPPFEERLMIVGVAVVLIGGFALLVNEKRKRADRQSSHSPSGAG